MEAVFQGPVKDSLTADERKDLNQLEADLARQKELQTNINSMSGWLTDPEMGDDALKMISHDRSELTGVNGRVDDYLAARSEEYRQALEARTGAPQFHVFKSGELCILDRTFQSTEVDPELKRQGVTAVEYDFRTYLNDRSSYTVHAAPIGVEGPERLSFYKVRVTNRSHEAQIFLGDQDDLIMSEFKKDGSSIAQPYQQADLSRLNDFQRRLIAQVHRDLGIAHVVVDRCDHCER